MSVIRADDELRGWIQPVATPEDDARKELESFGVQVGEWDTKIEEFKDCIVSREAMINLDPYWGRYIWGLA